MTRVVWAPQAIQDVEAIHAHIARDSTHYADLVVERLVAAIERPADHPALDAPCLSSATSQSERSFTATTVVYRLRHDVVEVATVFHGARLFRLDWRP